MVDGILTNGIFDQRRRSSHVEPEVVDLECFFSEYVLRCSYMFSRIRRGPYGRQWQFWNEALRLDYVIFC